MASPFPGMDPYLEQYWYDVHPGLMIYIRDHLQSKLPADLRARVEERVTLEGEDGEDDRDFIPDVRIAERPGWEAGGAVASTAVAAEPRIVRIPSITAPDRRVLILTGDRRLVTSIEVLSPSNKDTLSRRGRFQDKQRELLRQKVNVVEIDLLRAGMPAFSAPEELLRNGSQASYCACVVRGNRRTHAEIYSISLRQNLPGIRIPLRRDDTDIVLELQPLIDQAYRAGGYEGDIDYQAECIPPLTGDDAAWADALLREKGLRR